MSTRTKSKAVSQVEAIAGEPLTISNLLRSTRLGLELTQEEFGKILGLRKAYVCDIEKGRTSISIEQAIKFAKILKKSKKLLIQLVLESQFEKNGLEYDILVLDKKAS